MKQLQRCLDNDPVVVPRLLRQSPVILQGGMDLQIFPFSGPTTIAGYFMRRLPAQVFADSQILQHGRSRFVSAMPTGI